LTFNMRKLGLDPPKFPKIKNLIFDLGGVIIDVDLDLSMKAFQELGYPNFHDIFGQIKQTSLFEMFETGKIPAQGFRNELRKFKNHVSDSQIDAAWNAMIGPLPAENIELITDLRKTYRTFLLSNTNMIHIDFLFDRLIGLYGENPMERMFEHMYLSYEIGSRKPERESFQFVLDNAGIVANETIFIDDLEQNITSAKNIGIWAYRISNETLSDLFVPYSLKSETI